MGDRSGIEWTDATKMVDRNGRRVRLYKRIDPSRPGQQLRRSMKKKGLRWCSALPVSPDLLAVIELRVA